MGRTSLVAEIRESPVDILACVFLRLQRMEKRLSLTNLINE